MWEWLRGPTGNTGREGWRVVSHLTPRHTTNTTHTYTHTHPTHTLLNFSPLPMALP